MMKNLLIKYPIECILTIVFVILSIVLNMQFLDGSNINHTIAGHDEYIAVKEIYSILKPESAKHWIMAVISGNALYYGRIMFYIDAFFAAIPFWLFGIKGMILTVRLVHSIFLLSALIILAQTFLEKPFHKLLFFISTCCLYYSMYFIMMPKPEPHQLLCLAWFLNRFKKNDWTFTWHFIFLGIAYGLKFNILLLLPILFLIPVLKVGSFNFNKVILPGLKAFLFFLLGIIIAVPCLILSPVKPVFLTAYIHETFGSTEKLYDNANLSISDWLINGLGGAYLGMGVLAVPFTIFVAYRLIVSVKTDLKNKDYSTTILLASGFILSLVIMLKTKRLWPHYLWTSYILIVLGLILSVSKIKERKLRTAFWTIVCIFSGTSFYFFLNRELPLYLNLSNKEDVIRERELSIQAIQYVKTKYPNSRIGTDGSLLYPFEDFVSVDIFNPFAGKVSDRAITRFYWYTDFPEKIWSDSNNAIIFYKRHPAKLSSGNSNLYKEKQKILHQIYLENLNVSYTRDTSFGDVIVYKKITQ